MAIKKTGLGKGLDSMFPNYKSGQVKKSSEEPQKKTGSEESKPNKENKSSTQKSTDPSGQTKAKEKDRQTAGGIPDDRDILLVKTSLVEPNREQPRKTFDEDALIELSESIKQFGVIQPLLVTKKDGYYEIIAGERRWRAAKLAGVKEIPVIVKELTEKEIVEISLIENIQREDLNPVEEARAYQRLLTEFSMKQDEIAARVAKSRTTITNSLRLLKLHEKVLEMLAEGMISAGHARALLGLEDQDAQEQLALRILDEKLSVRDVERIVKSLHNKKEKKPAPVKSAALQYIYQEMEDHMKEILGTKVVLNRKSEKRGRIEIEYYSQAELERIYDLLKTLPS